MPEAARSAGRLWLVRPVWVSCLVLAAAGLLAACGGPAAPVGSSPAPSATPQTGGLVIRSGALDFDRQTLTVPAGTSFELHYVNDGPLPHNVAIYRDGTAAEPLFVGGIVETGSITYEVPALPAGAYYFRCDLHPEMDGQLIVE